MLARTRLRLKRIGRNIQQRSQMVCGHARRAWCRAPSGFPKVVREPAFLQNKILFGDETSEVFRQRFSWETRSTTLVTELTQRGVVSAGERCSFKGLSAGRDLTQMHHAQRSACSLLDGAPEFFLAASVLVSKPLDDRKETSWG